MPHEVSPFEILAIPPRSDCFPTRTAENTTMKNKQTISHLVSPQFYENGTMQFK